MTADDHKAEAAVDSPPDFFTHNRKTADTSSSSPTSAPLSSSKTLKKSLYDRTIMGRGLMWAYKGTRRFLIKREED